MTSTIKITRSNDEDFSEKLKQRLKDYFPEAGRIALKLHMGEPGNQNFIPANFVKQVVGVLKELKLKPFLFESLAAYDGGRNTVEKHLETAKSHGFTEEIIGCPIIISDESVVENVEGMDIEVCKDIVEADGVLMLSHVKGHTCTGVGGAIKNLGMGCVSKKSKKDIHDKAIPIFCAECGECNGCGMCEKVCVFKAIKVVDGKAVLDESSCWGCGQCVVVCPQKALKSKTDFFDVLLAKGAAAVVRKVESKAAPKKLFYVNVLKKITKFCDCASDGGPILAKDEGILLGEDPVAIDKASVDLINKQVGCDIFKKTHHKDPYLQIKTAEKLGMGSEQYELS